MNSLFFTGIRSPISLFDVTFTAGLQNTAITDVANETPCLYRFSQDE